jgi:hypothetical protein
VRQIPAGISALTLTFDAESGSQLVIRSTPDSPSRPEANERFIRVISVNVTEG